MHDPFIYTSTTKMTKDIDLINSVVELPNGVRVPNRLVKASMEEGIGTGGGLPGKHHQRLYSRWAEGGWGMIITGRYLLSHRNIG
jgi:2,4-dienoyl-CoA reductase-like NADH-dependent reductase (Old Yellow Enzyme family)